MYNYRSDMVVFFIRIKVSFCILGLLEKLKLNIVIIGKLLIKNK